MSSTQSFLSRSETFGLEGGKPWALEALRVLYCAPRVFQPLVEAWDVHNPGSIKALNALVDAGFAAHQPAVIVDTRTGQGAALASRKVRRLRLTAKGRRLLSAAREDLRTLEDTYPRMASTTAPAVLDLLAFFSLPEGASKYGRSIPHALSVSTMAESVTKWWISRWLADKILKELDDKLADVREVIPAHYRPTKQLSKQLKEALLAFPAWNSLSMELRLGRRSYLSDIDPARVGASGATDYDHDVECQRILALSMGSRTFEPEGYLCLEPRIVLPVDTTQRPYAFRPSGAGTCFYQPDAEYREHTPGSPVLRAILEYERFQTRRDAWNHIERYLGYLSSRTLPMEPSVLRFVVDSKARERGYVELIEAFADYALDNASRMPPNKTTLAVSSTARLESAADALDPSAWFSIPLAPGRAEPEERECVLHDSDDSPYDEYFGND